MGTLKVLQFNIQYGQGWSDKDPDRGEVNLDRTIAEIRAQDADIVLLQEVEHAREGGMQVEPPPNYTRLRAAFPGYDSFFRYPKADPRELPFGIGLAIFSRTPLRDTLWQALPSPPVEFEFQGEKKTPTDRLLIGATTTLFGHAVRIFNTHLLAFFMLESTSEHHHTQRDLLVEQLRKSDGPTLLGGGFQCQPARIAGAPVWLRRLPHGPDRGGNLAPPALCAGPHLLQRAVAFETHVGCADSRLRPPYACGRILVGILTSPLANPGTPQTRP